MSLTGHDGSVQLRSCGVKPESDARLRLRHLSPHFLEVVSGSPVRRFIKTSGQRYHETARLRRSL